MQVIYKLRNNNGTILFMSIIILTTILTAALGSASLMMSGIIISGNQTRSTQAYFAADAGIEESLWWARKSDTSTTTLENDFYGVASGTLSNAATYDVDYVTWGYIRNFTSSGVFNNTRRTVEAQYGYVPWDRIVYKCDADHLDLCECSVEYLSSCNNQYDCEFLSGTWDEDEEECS